MPPPTSMMQEEVEAWLKGLQDAICLGLEKLDGAARFREDTWKREGGGGGRSRILEGIPDSGFIEKGGVNYSAVYGVTPDFLRKEVRELKPELPDSGTANFFAAGVSLVIHPFSPWVP